MTEHTPIPIQQVRRRFDHDASAAGLRLTQPVCANGTNNAVASHQKGSGGTPRARVDAKLAEIEQARLAAAQNRDRAA
jgi:hypothetical protein